MWSFDKKKSVQLRFCLKRTRTISFDGQIHNFRVKEVKLPENGIVKIKALGSLNSAWNQFYILAFFYSEYDVLKLLNKCNSLFKEKSPFCCVLYSCPVQNLHDKLKKLDLR